MRETIKWNRVPKSGSLKRGKSYDHRKTSLFMEAEQDLIEAGVSFGTGEMVGSDLELREKLHQSSSCGNNNDDQDKD